MPVVRLSRALSETAVAHIARADPVMGRLIDLVGPFVLKAQRNRFRVLVKSIVSQQISTRAAQSIFKRLEEAAGALTPESLSALGPRALRSAGVSPQKQAYLKDLADHVLRGSVRLDRLGRMPDDDVIAELIQVKGIGRWTAQMFLIFTLSRPDVLPHDDLGVRQAIKRAYRLRDLPDKPTAHRIAEPWRPFATVASWYCWRSLSLPADSWATFHLPAERSSPKTRAPRQKR